MGSLGFDEMLMVIVVAIIIFGRDLPSVTRKVGRWYGKFKRTVNDVREEFQRQLPDDEFTSAGMAEVPPVALPGPDPSDPEYHGAFDPARRGDAAGLPSPAPPAPGSTPPGSPPPGGAPAAPPASPP